MNFKLPKLIGHRGVKDLAPENTLCSIKKAMLFNLKWVEIDVKISKDKIPFLLHDDILDRTTSGNGNPLNYKYADIAKLDAGSWFNIKYKNITPPTLKETLDFCSKNKIGVNIELKPNKGFEEENVLAIIKLLKKNKFSCQYFFSSFDWKSVILIKKLLPDSQVGILVDIFNKKNNIIKILDNCKKYNFFSCGFNTKIISNKIFNYCNNYKILITAYSSNNIEINEAYHLWDLGVYSIFIDNPKNYKNILNKV